MIDGGVGRFRFVAFDWDGTAVASRQTPAEHLVAPIERLVDLGTTFYVVTGTRCEWPARQLDGLGDRARAAVFVCCNRGSEVFCLGPGSTTLIARHVATPDEAGAIGEVASLLGAWLTDRGVTVALVSDRLNRIKIDLIPVEAWADPPKDRLPQLLAAVECRLAAAGGLGAAVREARRLAEASGRGLKVTSDVKHIEVGLTDKTDSMAWVIEHIADNGGHVGELLVVGDEFGPVAGLEGSDAKTIVEGATTVSVGAEPNGVPPGVIAIGGGPGAFAALLARIADSASMGPVSR